MHMLWALTKKKVPNRLSSINASLKLLRAHLPVALNTNTNLLEYSNPMEPEKSLHPPTPPLEHREQHPQTGDEKVDNLPETKKAKMKLIVTPSELEAIKEHRKLRISDLLKITKRTPQPEVGKFSISG